MSQKVKLVQCELCDEYVRFVQENGVFLFRCECTTVDLKHGLGIVPVIWKHLTLELAEQLINNAQALPVRENNDPNWDLQAFNYLVGHYKLPQDCAWLQPHIESTARACRYLDLAIAIADVTGIFPYWPYSARMPIDQEDALDARLMNSLN